MQSFLHHKTTNNASSEKRSKTQSTPLFYSLLDTVLERLLLSVLIRIVYFLATNNTHETAF